METTVNISHRTISSPSGPRIVVGIDYGTSNTELAWAQTDGSAKLSLADFDADLTILRDWPGANNQHVPSSISYSPTSPENHCAQWGWSIDDGSKVLQWTKLELEPQNTATELSQLKELAKGLDLVRELRNNTEIGLMNDVPKHITKSAEDVVRDYLTYVAKVWFQYMKAQNKFTLERVPLDLVITHPATWRYEAMNKTYRAVVGAFNKQMFPTIRNISFASEPESWALYTIQDMLKRGHDVLIPGECFVICDAGGGTVDLVSYRVENVKPLELTRVGKITGDKCGGTFVDHAFLEWVRPRLQNIDLDPDNTVTGVGTGGHTVFNARLRVLLERFEKIKHAFDGNIDGNISLPRGTKVTPGYEESIVNGVLTITAQDMKEMFKHSVTGTLSLLTRQLTMVSCEKFEDVPCRVTNIIMAGGFAESPYLFNEITRFAHRASDLHVQRADDCWIGIVKGAVLRGLDCGMASSPPVLTCPRHYGLCVSHKYQAWTQTTPTATVKDSFHGQIMVADQLFWLIRKGDAILPGESVETSFGIRCKFTKQQYQLGSSVRITFVASGDGDPPRVMQGLNRATNEVIYLDVDSQKIPEKALQKQKKSGGGSYLTADLEVRLNVLDNVVISVWHQGVRLKTVSTNL